MPGPAQKKPEFLELHPPDRAERGRGPAAILVNNGGFFTLYPSAFNLRLYFAALVAAHFPPEFSVPSMELPLTRPV
jgi:hypothetical protein